MNHSTPSPIKAQCVGFREYPRGTRLGYADVDLTILGAFELGLQNLSVFLPEGAKKVSTSMPVGKKTRAGGKYVEYVQIYDGHPTRRDVKQAIDRAVQEYLQEFYRDDE